MQNKKSKVVVITDASSGIGEATARFLAGRGDKVVLGARREKRLQKLTDAIKMAGGSAFYHITDVISRSEVEELAQLALDEYGQIDVWVNNADLMPIQHLIS